MNQEGFQSPSGIVNKLAECWYHWELLMQWKTNPGSQFPDYNGYFSVRQIAITGFTTGH